MSDFARAIELKYIEQPNLDDVLNIPSDKSITTQITLVGFGKICSVHKQLNRLRNIDLSYLNISASGDLFLFKDNLINVRVLNLSNNRITSWSQVHNIVLILPNLKELILNNNPIQPLIDDSKFQQIHYRDDQSRQLESLTFGETSLDWLTIIELICQTWSRVKQLDLWNNKLQDCSFLFSLTEHQRIFVENFESLKLRNNLIEKFSFLECIEASFENLTELDLSKNSLLSIDISHILADNLKNLKNLNISGNNLESWFDFAELHKLLKLENLICFDNPIYIKDRNPCSQVIGRLKNLLYLNRQPITDMERLDNEILYMRTHFAEYKTYLENRDSNFSKLHPRYHDIIDNFGIPEDLNRKATIKRYTNLELGYGNQRIAKKLPGDMRIADAKQLAKRLFRFCPSTKISLFAVFKDRNDLRFEVDKDNQTLNFYSIEDGSLLLVEKIE